MISPVARLRVSLASPLLAALAPAPASADAQIWQTIEASARLPHGLSASSESILRIGAERGLYELEENLMLGVRTGAGLVLSLGYTHNPTYARGHLQALERRLRQQLDVAEIARLGPLRLSGRLRLEQRWRDHAAGTGYRLRPALKASLPLAHGLSLAATHESFVALNHTGFQAAGYERMRNSLAVNLPVSGGLQASIGYLNQYRLAPTDMVHALTVGLAARF